MKFYYLAASILVMSYMGLMAAIADIAAFFPGFSVQVIQTGVTTINLMIIAGASIAGVMSARTTKIKLIFTGLSIVIVGGICGFLFHDTIFFFYLWSVVIGIGIGMFVPTMMSLMVDFFDDEERNKVAGMQTSFINGGGVALTFIGGLLATIAWYYSYLVFLVAVPIMLIFALKLYVNTTAGKTERFEFKKIPKRIAYYAFSIIAFVLLYNVFPANIALFIRESGLGDASLAGGVNAVFMCGGVFFGFIFSKFSFRLGNYLFAVAHTMLLICFFTMCLTQSLAVVFMVAFVGGMSISMTMPQALYSVSIIIPPQLSVPVFSFIASISPSIANFISPTAIGLLSRLVSDSGDSISRYTAAAILAIVFAVIQFTVIRRRLL